MPGGSTSGVAPAAVALPAVADALRDTNIDVYAQDVHWEERGAFTGQISRRDGTRFAVGYDRRPLRGPARSRRHRRAGREEARARVRARSARGPVRWRERRRSIAAGRSRPSCGVRSAADVAGGRTPGLSSVSSSRTSRCGRSAPGSRDRRHATAATQTIRGRAETTPAWTPTRSRSCTAGASARAPSLSSRTPTGSTARWWVGRRSIRRSSRAVVGAFA